MSEDQKLTWQWVRHGLVFLVVLMVTALFLWGVNNLTADASKARTAQAHLEAMKTVMPAADTFSETWFDREKADNLTAAFAGSTLVGYCVEVTGQGFSGPISMMVGVGESGSVTGVVMLSHSESARLGALADTPEFLNQFINRSGTIRVGGENNAIQAVTGATATSRAVTNGVNRALAAVANLQMEGGPLDEEGEV